MTKVPLRLQTLIGIALLVAAAVVWRYAVAKGGGNAAVEVDPEEDPIAARIEGHRRSRDTAALAKEASGDDVEAARLALYALAGSGSAGVPHIERAMRDQRPQVREAAAAALGRAAGRERSALLAEVVRDDTVASVRATAASALGGMRAYNEMETLMEALEDEDTAVRRRANAAISRITGIQFKFRADGPQKDRDKAIATMWELWPTIKLNLERHYARQPDKGREP